jgi:MFS family permease
MPPATARATSTQSPRSSLLVNRNFAVFWVGQGISVLGDQVFNTTLVVWIGAELTLHTAFSALALSGVLAAAALPALLFAPIAGVFVDRWDRRRTLLQMDGLRALIIAALLPAAGIIALPFSTSGGLSLGARLGAIYTAVFLASTCAQFFNPARLALIGDIVEESSRARASGLSQASQSLAAILGPPLAAPLLFAFGVEWALTIDALSFGVSFLSILLVRVPAVAMPTPQAQRSHLWQEMKEGVAFTLGNRQLMAMVVSLVLVVLGAGALNTLLIYFVTQELHTQATFFGFIGAAEGLGALLGALLAGLVAQRLGVARVYAWSMVVAALLFFVMARMTEFIPTLVVIAVIGVAEAAANVALAPLMLTLVPRALLGRVFALTQPFLVLAGLVGTALAGYLDSVALRSFHAEVLGQTFRPVDTIYLAAGLVVLLGGIYAVNTLRSADVVQVPADQAPGE